MAEGEPTITTTTFMDDEGRELRSLIDRANVGNIFEAALEHRSTDGAEAELQTHFGLAANAIPMALLETRAVTPAPSDVGATQSEIPGVFPQSCAALLGLICRPCQRASTSFPCFRQMRLSAPASGIWQSPQRLGWLVYGGGITAPPLASARLRLPLHRRA